MKRLRCKSACLLRIERICEVKQPDNISFGLIAVIDKERNEMHKMVFWLFSQKKASKYRHDNYIGRGYLGVAKALEISEVESCKLFIKKFELALTLGFGPVIDKDIERKLGLMEIELKQAKGRAKLREEVLKH